MQAILNISAFILRLILTVNIIIINIIRNTNNFNFFNSLSLKMFFVFIDEQNIIYFISFFIFLICKCQKKYSYIMKSK